MLQGASQKYRRSLLAVVAAVFAVALLPAISLCRNPNPGVLPPNSDAFGMTYGEWSARWWQWAVSLPVNANPLFDTADCNAGQLGKVWFLGGSFTGSPADRTCNVPAGKALFFPIIDADCSSVEPAPFFGADAEARHICAAGFVDEALDLGVDSLSADIDGVSVQDLPKYRAPSPDFDFTAPDNNLLIGAATSGKMAADGIYLLLAPLSAGEHTIHFSFVGVPGPGVHIPAQDVTYHLTVAK